MSEALGEVGQEALVKERRARKKAEREAAELRKFRRKFHEMRDRAELMEARANRYRKQQQQQKLWEIAGRVASLTILLQQMRSRVGTTAAAQVLARDLDHAIVQSRTLFEFDPIPEHLDNTNA